MNKLLRTFALLLLVASPLFITSCESDDPEETCNTAIEDFGTCSAEDISVCSDNDLNPYYIYKGDRKSEEQLDAICFAPSASAQERRAAKIQLDAFTQQLLFEVKAAALCN